MRRRIDPRLGWLLVAAAAVSLAWLGITIGAIAWTLEPEARERLWHLLGDRWVLVLLMWLAGMGAIAWGLQRAFEVGVYPWRRLAEEAQVLLRAEGAPALRERGPAEVRQVARLFNALVQQRQDLRDEMDARVRAAARDIEQEKSRLAALMSQLPQSVVVCNPDGRVLLYNNRARWQFRALSAVPKLASGAELIGLGRSIYAVFDRAQIAHALEQIRQRLRRGAAQPSAQFVTATRAGQLLRVQVAPVRAVDSPAPDAEDALAGFVLVLDNITQEYESAAARERLWLDLTEGSRRALANVRVALETLQLPEADAALRERLLQLVREEIEQLGDRLHRVAREGASLWPAQWPMEDMLAADLLAAIERRAAELGDLQLSIQPPPQTLWLRVDSFSLMQAVCHLLRQLHTVAGVPALRLRASAAPGALAQVYLDIVCPQGLDEATRAAVSSWEDEPMRVGADGTGSRVRDIIERHQGALWVETDPRQGEAFVRLLLPTTQPASAPEPELPVRGGSRPEYYDFDLFRPTPAAQALDDVPLAALTYTVFDTETTGLNPSGGDEIIQIGATRIVNGKLLRHESFEQLVNPRRPIPPATIPIHGITPEMVADQPDITQVLPAFYEFARDTVLVAHNAAFDMRFLQMKERVTGLVFDHPVLDTLLLSAVVHPAQPSHRLEDIAARFGIAVVGRHTALGDALVTAEVLLRLIPLLAEQGIVTFGQARRAAERTYYARLTY